MHVTLLGISLTLFFILNPFGFIPLIMKMLAPYPPKRQFYILTREMIFALIIMLVFGFFGSYVMNALAIQKEAISVGGGIVLFIIAVGLIFPHHAMMSEFSQESEPFIFPIATPLTAGGGALAALMMYREYVSDQWVFFWGIVIAWAANCVVYYFAPLLVRLLSPAVLKGIEKLMGLLLILISAQIILSGIISFTQTKPAEDGTQNVVSDVGSDDAAKSLQSTAQV